MAIKALTNPNVSDNGVLQSTNGSLVADNAQINDPLWWMQNQQYLGKTFDFSAQGSGRNNEGSLQYYEYTPDSTAANGLIPYNPSSQIATAAPGNTVQYGGTPKGVSSYLTSPAGLETIGSQQYINPADYNFNQEASDQANNESGFNKALGGLIEAGTIGTFVGAATAGTGLAGLAGAAGTGAATSGGTAALEGASGANIAKAAAGGAIGGLATDYMPAAGSVTGSTTLDKLGESAITTAGKSLVGSGLSSLFGNNTSVTGDNNMATTQTSSNPLLTDITGLLNGVTQTANSALQGNAGKQADLTAAQQADPYQQYRGQAASQLNNLINNPGQVNGLGTAEAQAAQQAVERSGAAKGLMNSPAMALALQQQASNSTQSSFDDMFSKLSTLAGGNNAGASAQYTADSGKSSQSQINGVANGTAGILGSLANGLFGGAGGTSGGGILGALGSGATSLYNSLFGTTSTSALNGVNNFGTDAGTSTGISNAVSNIDTSGASSFLDNSGNIDWSSLMS